MRQKERCHADLDQQSAKFLIYSHTKQLPVAGTLFDTNIHRRQ